MKDRYFKLNRILLLAVGLWPYQKSKLVQFQFICFFGILITSIIFQVMSVTLMFFIILIYILIAYIQYLLY